ncbi:hypothetical protein IGL98_000657 [Enterococcus sp. DIV0840]|uniref:hypothetical protein n=1 Tax=Enterococcus TaxID=1350 RepID=UPI001A8EF7BE|nr:MULTISPECIES: hypothetical protein [Enterococcus]MBO0434611.1 hypothetical protein [Enterococcus sp. DIV0849a]MBO0472171.1 hypothetical protein [Enterococcus ureasiticus]
MKKKTVEILIAAVVTLSLVSCSLNESQRTTNANYNEIMMGMTQKKVENKLGKAMRIIKKQEEISEHSEIIERDLNSLATFSEENPKKIQEFVGENNSQSLKKQLTAIKEVKKLEIHQYKLTNGKIENLYMIDNIVILKSLE